MTYYARVDLTQAEPRSVVAWYDTDFAPFNTYLHPPPADELVELTPDQWLQHFTGNHWKVRGDALINFDPPRKQE